jgi:hypothetical protein
LILGTAASKTWPRRTIFLSEQLSRIAPPVVGQSQRPTCQKAGRIGYTWLGGRGGCLSRWPGMDTNPIRNFCITAHNDHGKCMPADRRLHLTGTVPERDSTEQILDSMDLEREKGVTIRHRRCG